MCLCPLQRHLVRSALRPTATESVRPICGLTPLVRGFKSQYPLSAFLDFLPAAAVLLRISMITGLLCPACLPHGHAAPCTACLPATWACSSVTWPCGSCHACGLTAAPSKDRAALAPIQRINLPHQSILLNPELLRAQGYQFRIVATVAQLLLEGA